MSRSNYSDCLDEWDLIRWRGQVASAIRGKRGQRLLVDLVAALDAMPEKVLITEELVNSEGNYCALGAVGARRGIDMSHLDPEESETVAEAFDIADPLAREITYINDERGGYGETPQQRWQRVRDWAIKQIRPVPVEIEATEHESLNTHDAFSLTAILNEGGEHCRNCSTPEYPIWRVLRGREIERCPNCGDEALDVYDFAEDDPLLRG